MDNLHFKKPKTYKLQDRYKFQGLPISVENKKGGYRYGTDKDGHSWKTKMYHDYGYIRGTNGNDNEAVDVYVGPDKQAIGVYIVHQHKIQSIKDPIKYKKSGSKFICRTCKKETKDCKHNYDEDKVMLGFSSKEEAIKAYNGQYDHAGFLGPVSTYTLDEFKEMLKGDKKKIPFKRLSKAIVKSHVRHLKSGKTVVVKTHTDKRNKQVEVKKIIPNKDDQTKIEDWKKNGVYSKSFKDWFRNSKVVDDDENPLIVYHGSERKFDSFDTSKLGKNYSDEASKTGFFFAKTKEEAEHFGSNVGSFYLSSSRIMTVDADVQTEFVDEWLSELEESDPEEYDFQINTKQYQTSGEINKGVELAIVEAKRQMYDGVKIVDENGEDWFVVFDPKKIKSADNQGTFDKNTSNLYKSFKRLEKSVNRFIVRI